MDAVVGIRLAEKKKLTLHTTALLYLGLGICKVKACLSL